MNETNEFCLSAETYSHLNLICVDVKFAGINSDDGALECGRTINGAETQSRLALHDGAHSTRP